MEYWHETYNALLRKHGYYTGFIGKWGFDFFPIEEFDVGKQYEGWHYDAERKIHITHENELDAIQFLKSRPIDKPFILNVAFFATHAEDNNAQQYRPQNSSRNLYNNVTVPISASATIESWNNMPYFFDKNNEGRRRWYKRFNTDWKYQYMMKNYFRMATEVDHTCGQIINELKNQGIYDNTLIIFTTDNGYFHAEHGKQYNVV